MPRALLAVLGLSGASYNAWPPSTGRGAVAVMFLLGAASVYALDARWTRQPWTTTVTAAVRPLGLLPPAGPFGWLLLAPVAGFWVRCSQAGWGARVEAGRKTWQRTSCRRR